MYNDSLKIYYIISKIKKKRVFHSFVRLRCLYIIPKIVFHPPSVVTRNKLTLGLSMSIKRNKKKRFSSKSFFFIIQSG